MTDYLSTYGFTFQIKVITALLTDKAFLQQISDILSPEYFESEANNWIVTTILDYHNEYKKVPTLEVMKVKLSDVEQEVLKTQIISHLKEAWKLLESTDLEYIKDQTIDFCKNQEIKKAILKSVELLKRGDYDGIKKSVDSALKSGSDKNIGHVYLNSIEDRYTAIVRNVLPTPWDVINDLMSGGLGKGELGVVVAPAGIGKCIGPNTLIDIEYEEIGLELKSTVNGESIILWVKPWEQFNVGNGFIFYGWELEALFQSAKDIGNSI